LWSREGNFYKYLTLTAGGGMMDKVNKRKTELKKLRRKAIKLQNASAGRLPMTEAMKMVKTYNGENSDTE
jgi:hypothetical protein